MKNNYKEIIALVKKKNIISRTIIMLIGVMILALNYNIFLLNNNLVVGGTSGLAVILKALWNIPPAEFIFISGLILIIVSFIFIGKEQTGRTIVGAIIYPIFIKVTTPIATAIIPHVTFDSLFLSAIVGGLLFGLANGLIYKTGFSTGGSDVIIQILNKYLKIPTGKSVFFKTICGFSRLTEGEVICNGKVIGRDMDFIQDAGVVIETPEFINDYSGFKNLKLLAQVQNKIGDKEILETLEMVGLSNDKDKKVRKYSLGMKQKLRLAQAFMEKPKILILDEPMNGLDKKSVLVVRSILNRFVNNGGTLLMTSHNAEDIQTCCEYIYEFDNQMISPKK